jgi:glycosyltransferase involved in cell wall biosynthesis
MPFVARHSSGEVAGAYRAFGLDEYAVPQPAILPVPRPILYEAWNRVGHPRLSRLCGRLADADIIHAPLPAVPPREGQPLVVTVHDAGFELFPGTYPRRGRRFHQLGVAAAARRADLIIAVSESAATEIVDHTPIRRGQIRVVPNGIDHVRAAPADVARALEEFGLSGLPYVLWVGSLEPRKNLVTLVNAFAALADDGPSTHRLVLVGPSGWMQGDALPAGTVAALGDRVRALGRVSDDDLRALYAGADLFAFPSLHEGFGLPVLEAMVQATPVVCADIPALREVAGSAARFVAPRDVAGWAQALRQLLKEEAIRLELAEAGRIRADAFSWERTVKETRLVYEEALSTRPGSPPGKG